MTNRTWAALLFAGVVASGCQCGNTPPNTPDAGDAGRADEVRLATAPLCLTPESVSAPTKLVVVVDNSGTTCLTDPGEAPDSGFCAQISSDAGVSRRVTVLNTLIDRAAATPDVSMAFVVYGGQAQVLNAGGGGFFVAPSGVLKAQLASYLATPLGGPTDLENALVTAHALVANDVNAVRNNAPDVLARTTYRVIVLADGPPAPRCAANDSADAGGSPDNVAGLWPDSTTACNDPAGFDGGDHNQTAALLQLVDQLKSEAASAQALRVDTVFFFNDANLAACGVLCQDVFGQYPGVAPSAQYEAAKRDARGVLTAMATQGGGTLRDLDTTSSDDPLADVAFPDGGVTSAQVLFAVPRRSMTGAEAPRADSDGDGLPDSREAELQTDPLLADTDGDCFSDGFEAARAGQNFNPLMKDLRGCDPAAPMTLNCTCRDIDGDGLSQFEELFLGTAASLPDSDFDGVLDGLEARSGMNPKAKQPGRDGDGDSVTDVAELLLTSDPADAGDTVFRQRYGVTPRLSVESQQGTQTCWNIAVDGLSTVAVTTDAGVAQGYNLVQLLLGEGRAADDIQKWTATCVWVKRESGSGTVPTVTFPGNKWKPLAQLNELDCEGTPPP